MSTAKLCEILSETLVCADGATTVRRLTRGLQADGTYANTVTFHNPITDADIGTPAVVGDASACEAAEPQIEELVFCDAGADGAIVIRTIDELTGVVSYTDVDGAAYTVVGPLEVCDTDIEVRDRTLCHDDGSGVLTTVTELVVITDGTEAAPVYLDGAGAAFVPTGSMSVGQCPMPRLDVVQRPVCVDNGDGTFGPGVEYRGIAEADGSVVWTNYVLDDGTELVTAELADEAACCC